GDYIVVIGGRVGQDGIHGATFSSEEMSAGSPATAVQIGDPITQKKFSDAIIREARQLNLYNSITDNGAGGISCSVAEMAKECNGCRVFLEKVPLKYPGLAPWKIWISESQERMTLAVPKNKWKVFKALMDKRGVEASVIGEFTSSGKCVVAYRGKKIMDIELEFLHNGLPVKQLKTVESKPQLVKSPQSKISNLTKILEEMLGRLNIASFEFISRQYDHEVQAGSVLKPLQGRGEVNGDAAVIRPVLSSEKGVVMSSALAPSYSELDSYKMAAASIDGAVRAAVVAGGDVEKMAILDNFCWCDSNNPERLWQLKRAVEACYDYSVAYGTPFISGKDSMFNDFKGFDERGRSIMISVPPTLLVSAIGVIANAEKAISLDFKFPGDPVYILGETYEELGGSEFLAYLGEEDSDARVPAVDSARNLRLYKSFARCAEDGIITSGISLGRGGLGVALAKSAIGGRLGAEISLKPISRNTSSDAATLFSESQGRILVSIAPANKKRFEERMKGHFTLLGKVSKSRNVRILGRRGSMAVSLPVASAERAYKLTFKNY
ncbi:MAG: AIR synthase-related protein, partial [bacterium]|nr:AIR synthase-related protein [bacterium]